MIGEDKSSLEKLDNFVFSKVSETKLPSLTLAVVKNEKIEHARAFGFKNVEESIPTGVETIYGTGSVSKSFTALAISKLVEDGKLDFRDPVSKFFPALDSPSFERMQIHHLLSHSSGIPGLGWAEVLIFNAIGKSKKWLPLSSIEDMATFLDRAESWREAEPGSKFFYLNEGYFILGEIIAKVSGASYYEYVKEKILAPLKMTRTFLFKEDLERDGNWALPYLLEDEKIVRSNIPWGSGAAGGVMSNVLDLSNYVMMYLGRGEFSGKRIVGEDMIKKMETLYSKPPLSVFPDTGYGYGLFVTNDFFGEKMVRHDGSVSVCTSGIAYLPDRGIGISLLCNGSGYAPNLISYYALSLLLGKDPETDLEPIRRERLLIISASEKTHEPLGVG